MGAIRLAWGPRVGAAMLSAAGLTAGLLMATSAAADSGTDFYKDRTVTYIVSTAPGGGHDYYGRLTSRHMQRLLPGSTFGVKNVPGAGHLIGTNTIYASKPDGLTIGTFVIGLAMSQIIGKDGVKFDLTKMSWIGKGTNDTRVLLLTAKSGLNSYEDMKNAKREIKIGVNGVGAGDYNQTVILRDTFKLPLRPMMGYGGPERSMAMMRGDVDGTMGGYSSMDEIGTAVQARIVLAFGNDVPDATTGRSIATNETQRKIIDLIEGEGAINRLLVGPPAIPADRLATLRRVYLEAFNSPELKQELGKRPWQPLGGEEVATMIKAMIDQPPEVVAILKGLSWND